jgi:hypothetical protein
MSVIPTRVLAGELVHGGRNGSVFKCLCYSASIRCEMVMDVDHDCTGIWKPSQYRRDSLTFSQHGGQIDDPYI